MAQRKVSNLRPKSYIPIDHLPLQIFSQMITAKQIELVRATFFRVEGMGQVAALTFYQRLFTLNPLLRPLFRNDIEEQAKKLMAALRFIVDTLETPNVMIPTVESLGRRHATYGVREEYYDTVGLALLDMLERVLGAAFTKDTRVAWTAAYATVSGVMKRAASTVPVVDSQDQLNLAPSLRPP